MYAVPFFGNKRIDNIKTSDFMDYLEYRRTHFKKNLPKNDTLIRERSTLLGVFKYAKNKGYLVEIPNFPKPQGDDAKRDTWTVNEYKKSMLE